MKRLERLFRKIGEADVHVWGYSTINAKPNKSVLCFSFQDLVI